MHLATPLTTARRVVDQVGEHIGSKGSKLTHNPIDFTVPLQHDVALFRKLWTDSANKLRPLPPQSDLVVLDHFSEVSSLQDLAAQGHAALSQHAELAAVTSAEASEAGGGTAPPAELQTSAALQVRVDADARARAV